MSELNVLECDLETARKVFWLLGQDAIFISSYNSDKEEHDDGLYPTLICNDLFGPGADAEKLDAEDLDLYIEAVKIYGQGTDAAWCQVKRGVPAWRRNGNLLEPWYVKHMEAVDGITKMLNHQQLSSHGLEPQVSHSTGE